MNKAVLASILAGTVGCGAILNKNPESVTLRPGISVDGQTGTVEIDQQKSHVVTFPDGKTCTMEPGLSVGYLVLDLVLTFPIGIIIDAVTGGWTVSKGCEDLD